MNTNAISVANYFIDLAKESSIEIRQFGLMKRVYITHGFCLAILGKSALDSRFDVVEAWKNGPVIPSVYHSFKNNRSNPVTEKSVIADITYAGEFDIKVPELQDEQIKAVADAVWGRYISLDDNAIVRLLHQPGTPWALCYEEGKNNKIPDSYTKMYYKQIVDHEKQRQNYAAAY
jgi:uncharacterized phage-associated protein